MSVCDRIEQFIVALLEEQQGAAELKRNELAAHMGCAPSQISYVLSTRFSPLCGYVVESRRGGGGCIRITRVDMTCSRHLSSIVESELRSPVSEKRAKEMVHELVRGGFITQERADVMLAAVSTRALERAGDAQDAVRSSVLGAMLLHCSIRRS